jgi:pimeloyl-ACP methyl ester carboxylesterase
MIIHLVHRAFHGRWCWSRVATQLQAQGHRVVANDLPGLGQDRTPSADISLETYVDAVCDALTAEEERVLLVGHSMGGIVLSQAAERLPDKIKSLVYVSAYLLCDGQSMMDIVQADENLTKLAPFLVSNGAVCTFRADKVRDIFYGHCTDSDADWATSKLVPQPLAPFAAPVHVTGERFGRIPKFYIQCLADHAVPRSAQDRMLAATSCERVVSIATHHSPFLSTPGEFVAHILSFCS